MSETVCTVVVTYNRKHLLRKCLAALAVQTRPPETILVVDNASSDGTLALVQAEFPQVRTLALPANTGGAGGFHAGIKWAAERDYAWIWVMDDDGQPAAHCLEILLAHAEGRPDAVLGPLCVRIDDETRLAFPAPLGGDDYGQTTNEVAMFERALNEREELAGWACFFNGIFLPRSVVQAVGLPRKEMFIWGDEVEYAKRIRAHGFPIATVGRARHRHPADKMIWQPTFSRQLLAYAGQPDWKAFCFFRNLGLLNKTYGKFGGASVILRYLYYYLIQRKGDIRGLSFFLSAYLAGRRGDFSRKVPY